MLTPVIEKLTKRDAEMCRAFKSIIHKGKFEVQGDALTKVGAFFKWFDDLDKRIEKTLEPEPPETIRKEVGHVDG
jgi:hypothetical protein